MLDCLVIRIQISNAIIMKQSFINQITLCDKCNMAFIMQQEGDETTCDGCLDADYEDLSVAGMISENNSNNQYD